VSRKKLKQSFKSALLGLVKEYRESGGKWPIDAHSLAAHLLANRKVKVPRRTETQILAKQLQEAMREEYYTDPQGRRVRKKHAFPVTFDDGETRVQKMLWCDIETALPDQMHLALQTRRKQAQGDVRQIKIDRDSYCDNNTWGAELPQMTFNFDKDMAELDQPATYQPPPSSETP